MFVWLLTIPELRSISEARHVHKCLLQEATTTVRAYRLVNLAVGTGKFTEADAVQPGNWEVIAVKSHPQCKKRWKWKHLEGGRVVDGTASRMEVVDSGRTRRLRLMYVPAHGWRMND